MKLAIEFKLEELWVLSSTFRRIFGQGFFANRGTNEIDFPNLKPNL